MQISQFLLLGTSLIHLSSAVGVEEEFRALWIATVVNVDWPSRPGLSGVEQQQEMIALLDLMQDLNMNAVVLQVRCRGDALYESAIEPWSSYLSGVQGQPPDPYYDPLAFAIEEAHNRSIEVHAWLNPYRASVHTNTSKLAPNHIAHQHPEHVHVYGNNLWMDPGSEVIQHRLIDVIIDVVERYDVDAIHYDDYFYPYKIPDVDFPDELTYLEYLLIGGELSRDDWRRDNINRLVEGVYNAIKEVKSHVKFGISPFGLYRPGHPEGMPPPLEGMDQYKTLYADPKLWLQRGWVDYLAPQIYWEIDPPQQSFPAVLDWWLQPEQNVHGRHIYAGQSIKSYPLEMIGILRRLKIRLLSPESAKRN